MSAGRQIQDCPFCEGEFDGCCFCDHTGKIYVGEGEFFKTSDDVNSIGVKFLKDTDPGETWPEMWQHFMKEENVPEWFKNKQMPKEQ